MKRLFLFTNIKGCFVFDEKQKIILEEIFGQETKNKFYSMNYSELESFFDKKENEILEKLKSSINNEDIGEFEIVNLRKNPYLNTKLLNNFLARFSNKEFFGEARKILLNISVNELSIVDRDTIISLDVDSLKQLTKVFNILTKRIREYLSVLYPEIVYLIEDDEFLIKKLKNKKIEELLLDLNIKCEIKPNLNEETVKIINSIIDNAFTTLELLNKLRDKIDREISDYCPETAKIATPIIAAKLLKQAGGLKELAMMSSSKVQLLGAEKALFRHLKTGTKPPKYGIIYQHPEILKADKKLRGKIARKLASKIVLSARKDYFSKINNKQQK
ncbi:MAG: hypothetical protein QXU20_01360 [Candidatus Woesearchaeota archaeon]